MTEIELFIRDEAALRGIDGQTAIDVANSEGGVEEYARHGSFNTGDSWWAYQSGQMLPGPTAHNVFDALIRHAEHQDQLLVRRPHGVEPADVDDFLRGEPRMAVLLTTEARLPVAVVVPASGMATLENHVRMVVLDRAQEEVIWTDTRAIVTAVEYPEACWDSTVVQTPRDAMHAGAGERTVRLADLDVAVATASTAGREPTSIRAFALDDAAPEARCELLIGKSAARVARGSMVGHRSSSLRCHAPGCCKHRGGFLLEFYHERG